MKLQDIEDDLPMLMKHYERVLKIIERMPNAKFQKAPRREVLEMFLRTRSFKATADHFGVSRATVNNVVFNAFRTARNLEGL